MIRSSLLDTVEVKGVECGAAIIAATPRPTRFTKSPLSVLLSVVGTLMHAVLLALRKGCPEELNQTAVLFQAFVAAFIRCALCIVSHFLDWFEMAVEGGKCSQVGR